MAIGTSKMLLFGASAASIGGGVAAGASMLPSSKEEREVKLTSAYSKEPEDISTLPSESKKCILYVTNEATTSNITKILSRLENVQEFLETKKTSDPVFVTDVETACLGQTQGKFVDAEEGINVYEKNEKGGKKWIYSTNLQKDWMKVESVNKDAITHHA
ncbi:hypothetical protein HF1_10510 [Mycoplasma haemofelis str. Langford 1]|uniref:Uncharacterized protein n=1 Tax=Mycoplasma haemofelis (strain Langford 1) TaxID=941640 RepID=E8ZIT8_MYCHL|nr:hypothetical protein [Mycoplasma haemofelis]CBY93059.1 hypothetical protein HF1_10510 [Mycoplasma haemofelis str. Langford 1]